MTMTAMLRGFRNTIFLKIISCHYLKGGGVNPRTVSVRWAGWRGESGGSAGAGDREIADVSSPTKKKCNISDLFFL
jgi:hypothetical protein